MFCSIHSFSQCPPNIDFETGSFAGWKLYTGSNSNNGGLIVNEIPAPLGSSHQIISAAANSTGRDPFGHFPVLCPNGSNYSVRLGFVTAGAHADALSYEFTVPADAPQFTLTYHYAVVLADPGHEQNQQPRFVVNLLNLTDAQYVDCTSFNFSANAGIPGFILSNNVAAGVEVYYRDWSANSIRLDGKQGKTFRISFTAAGCTLGAHFGYAYFDIETRCNNAFNGDLFCPGDTALDLRAPYGYRANYTWYPSDFSHILGTGAVLHLAPPPPAGTLLKVIVEPEIYGCTDTIPVTIGANLQVSADAGHDKVSCSSFPVQIGSNPVQGVVYRWQPATGLSNPDISNPFATVSSTTQYILTAKSPGGGCIDVDTVKINKPVLDSVIRVIGNQNYCIGSPVSTILEVHAADSIQWYKDDVQISGANQNQLTVTQEGIYKAFILSYLGCSRTTAEINIRVYPSPHASFAVDNAVQCSPRDTFSFTNTSNITSGGMQFIWNFGDGITSSAINASHTYNYPGTYNIVLHADAEGGCYDDTAITVLVKAGADPDFSVKSVCMELQLPVVNNTNAPGAPFVNYSWDFGNGQTAAVENPVYSYPLPGTYPVTLTTSTPACPVPENKIINVIITAPKPALRYADHPAIIDYPEPLAARNIGTSALWSPPVNLNTVNSYAPVFKGATSQLYTITLKTAEGCITVDTVFVKTYKKIAINVPSVFTPNGDGNNDFLRPLLFGFKKVNYFRVYNRAGQIVFQMANDKPGWDGKIHGADQGIQTFVWVIEAVDVDGILHNEKGTVSLIR